MPCHICQLDHVEFTTNGPTGPLLALKLGWATGRPSYNKAVIGLDPGDEPVSRLARVAAALSAACGVDNYTLIRQQPVRLIVDRLGYLIGVDFLRTEKTVDLAKLFRGCAQVLDGGLVPPC